MKKLIALLCLCITFGCASPIFAQCDKNAGHCSHNKTECKSSHPKLMTPGTVKLLKENYIKENLTLNDNQKDAFWKAYQKYEAAKTQANETARTAMEKAGISNHECCKEGNRPTDEQAVAAYTIQLEKRQALLAAEQAFFKEISKNLTKEQIAQYLRLEKSFMAEMHKLNSGNRCEKQHQPCGNHAEAGCHKPDQKTIHPDVPAHKQPATNTPTQK